jgi:ATP-dependent Zn protease
VEGCLARAESLLEKNEDKLERLAKALLDRESLNAQEIEDFIEENAISAEPS